MTDRKKGTIHIRTAPETERQLRALAEQYGTITTAVTVAVDRLYRESQSRKERTMVYFSAWQIHTEGLPGLLRDALNANRIKPSDVVWYGPSGDVVVADDVAHTEYDEYTDNETVAEWLDAPELL